jgi:acetyl esterase/lipase
MKKIFVLLLSFVSTYTMAQDLVLDVWSNTSPPTDNGLSGPEELLENNRVANISVAKMYFYFPEKEKNTGAAMVICPGGAYIREAMSHEGYEVAEWLKERGITGIVLKYRLPNGHHQVPLEDAQRAMRIVRYNANEWGIDPNKIGIAGSSAGGNLAANAGTRFTFGDELAEDPIEKISSRPNFMLLLYPFIAHKEENMSKPIKSHFFGKDKNWETAKKYSPQRNVTEYTPPTFMVHADNDKVVESSHSIELYLALKKFNIPAEMHIFQDGGHGFGITKIDMPAEQWTELFYQWLKQRNIIEK